MVVLKPNVTSLSVLENKKSVIIECIVVHASPKPLIAWYKNFKRIKACSKSLNCSLEITNLKHPVDDGTYTCVAENTEGAHNVSLELKVLGKSFQFFVFFLYAEQV